MERMTKIESLMYFRIGWQTESYAKSAIELITCQCDESSLNNLLAALSTNGKANTGCVPVIRTGRFNAFRSLPDGEYPHVLYAKIWRWPSVRKEELKHLPHCKCAFNVQKTMICVNPYHYERVIPMSNGVSVSSTSKSTENYVRSRIATVVKVAAPMIPVVDGSKASATDTQQTKTDELSSDKTSDELLDMLGTSFNCPSLLSATNHPCGSAENPDQPSETVMLSEPSLERKVDRVSVPCTSPENESATPSTSDQPVVNLLPANESTRKRNSSSSSSDDGFEIINYDMDVDELNAGADSKTTSTVYSVAENQGARNELSYSETTVNPDHLTTLSVQKTMNNNQTPNREELPISFKDLAIENASTSDQITTKSKETEESNVEELRISFNHFLAEPITVSSDVIPSAASDVEQYKNNNELLGLENNVDDEQTVTVKMETENEDSKVVIESADEWKKKYEKLREEHEKLKIAFVEAGFAATGGSTLRARCKEVQKVMDTIKAQFDSTCNSSEQYKRLKKIVDNGSATDADNYSKSTGGFFRSGSATSSPSSSPSSAASASPSTSPSSFFTGKPYRRKIKPSVRKFVVVKPFASSNSGLVTVTTTAQPNNFDNPSTFTPFYFTGLSSANPIGAEQKIPTVNKPRIPLQLIPRTRSVFPGQVKIKEEPGQGRNELQGSSGQIPQPVAGPSHVFEQPKVKEEAGLEGKCNDETSEAKLEMEIKRLLKRVMSLEAQLEMQKQDEIEKMTHYTNSMREHYMQTVNRLNELNKELTEKLTEKETQIVNQIDPQEVTLLLDDKDREINNLNDHLLSLCALLTANEDEILQLRNEKRNLKRNSESEETDEEISLKRRPDSQDKVESNREPLTPQHVFDYLCAELEKSSMKTSEENPSEDDASNQENVSSNNVPSNDRSTRSEPREINTLTTSIRDIEEREQVMSARFSEVIAELEVMKITHDKTKSDLEARLKNGAKQYAKLYLKYDKLKKGSPSSE